jgi:hypothetical protein
LLLPSTPFGRARRYEKKRKDNNKKRKREEKGMI